MDLNRVGNITEIFLLYFLKTIAALEVTIASFQKYLKTLWYNA